MKKTLFKKASYIVLSVFMLFFAYAQTAHAAFQDGVQAKYGVDFASFEEEKAAANEFNIELAGESFILLKNEDQALPLTSSEKYVSLFGTRSDNIILGGSGSGSGSTAGAKSVQESLEAAGLKVNPTLLNLYASTNATTEPSIDFLAGTESSYAMYDDAAIIMLSRTGSEFNDAALYQVVGHSNLLDHYYSLDDNEKDLVNEVTSKFEKVIVAINSAHPIEMGWLEDHPGVDSILWIGHTGTTGIMAFGKTLVGEINPSGKTSDIYPARFANDPTWANFKGNIQSQLVLGEGEDADTLFTYYESEGSENNIPAPLNNGTDGIAGNDWNYYSYSRVTDSLGQTVTVDGPSKGARYYATLDYEEGIYVGYRWYETAHAEGYFDVNSRGITLLDRIAATPEKYAGDLYYNRIDGVIYPFGYGLSYTSFDVEIDQVIHDDATFVSGSALNTAYGQEITLNVSVKNTGLIAGKKVVQIYYSAPYISGEIEKSSVALVEFAKSKVLKPGQEQIIPITFKVQRMASFDHVDANNSGHAGYELDPGIYKIGVYDNSHDILDFINAEVVGSVVNYDLDADTGNPITVKFTGDGVWDGTRTDLDYYDTRRTSLVSETPWTELTRADFEATFPEAPTASDLRWSDDALLIMQSQVYYSSFNDLPTDPWYKDADDVTGWTQAADTSERIDGKTLIQLYELSGVDWDDPLWDEFLNQLTFDELRGLISSNRFTTPALESIGKPSSSDQDGPAQIRGGTFWVCEVNIASTWNTELAYKQGLFVGNESLYAGTHGWYGPGLNMHRNPAAGRNFEYYSQDGVHAGKIAAAVIKGATDKGVTTYMKHLFLNDQETSRYTVSTFVSEQALREIYGIPWEYAIKHGNATASMSGFNKVGLLSTTSNYNLYVGLMRDEWGFRYSTVTDMFGWGYSPGSSGDMAARTNITPLGSWVNSFGRNIEGSWDAEKNNVVVTFNENVTNGTRWTKDDATGTSTATINSNNPVKINYINNRDFTDYETSGIVVDYATTTLPGPSAAYKDATNMKDGTELYVEGDTLESYTQWYAVRTAAKSLLFAQTNSNTMRNGIVTSGLEGKTIDLEQGVAAGVDADLSFESLPGAIYTFATNSNIPAGLSISSNGRLTGTPTEAGTITIRVDATMYGYITATVNHTINVAPTFVATGLDTLKINEAVTGTIGSVDWYIGKTVGSGWRAPKVDAISFSIIEGSLPAGVSLDADGNITGTPIVAGTFNVLVGTHVGTSTASTFFDFVTPVQLIIADIDPADYAEISFAGNYEAADSQAFTVKKGSTASPIAAPYRPGYIFTGWYTDAAATTVVDFSQVISEDVTVYAGWLAVDAAQDALDVAIADLNALITALDTKADVNADAIDDLEALIATVNAAITASNGEIEDLDEALEALTTAMTALQTALETADGELEDELDALDQAVVNINTLLETERARIDTIEADLEAPESGCGSSLTVQNSIFITLTLIALLSIGFVIRKKRTN